MRTITKALLDKHFESDLGFVDIIKQRINQQSTKQKLKEKFAILDADLDKLTSPEFLKELNTWSGIKKHNFLLMIGGYLNYEKTKVLFGQRSFIIN